jgi:hypothetical protein
MALPPFLVGWETKLYIRQIEERSGPAWFLIRDPDPIPMGRRKRKVGSLFTGNLFVN